SARPLPRGPHDAGALVLVAVPDRCPRPDPRIADRPREAGPRPARASLIGPRDGKRRIGGPSRLLQKAPRIRPPSEAAPSADRPRGCPPRVDVQNILHMVLDAASGCAVISAH